MPYVMKKREIYTFIKSSKSRHILIATCLESLTEHGPIVATIDAPLAEKLKLIAGVGAGIRFTFITEALMASGCCYSAPSSTSLVSPLTLNKA